MTRDSQDLIDLAHPRLRRIVTELAIDANAGGADLRSVFQTGDCPSLCLRTGALPIAKEHPMADAWGQEMADRPEYLDCAPQFLAVLSRRVQEQIAIRETKYCHPERQREAAGNLDRLAIHNPNAVRDPFRQPRTCIDTRLRQRTAPLEIALLFSAEILC
jgi:hypothetical protein